ncbi:zincin [Ophiobolus disseminans]|uniref:Zincin n=1 Tax=Ophiobolus disseminans TaxID=1469910 RepID=A0A6A6ZG91_9PLEO|nr:zincin [Ophiobolus disseminans]
MAELCLSSACIHAASGILYNLSLDYKKLDPCNDFEELVCGGWRDRHDLRPSQGQASTGTSMSETTQRLLRHILEAPYPKDSQQSFISLEKKFADQENFDKMKAAYDTCLDEDQIKNIGAAPLLQFLDEIKKAYPTQGTEGSSSHALSEPITLLTKYGIPNLVAVGTGADARDPDTVIVTLSAPSRFGLSKQHYENEMLVEKYRAVTIKLLSGFYPDHQNKASFGKIVDLEKRLAAASPDSEDRRDVTKYYNPMLIEHAAAIAPEIELKALLSGLAPAKNNIKRVVVTAPAYLKQLSNIIAATDKETLQNFFLLNAIKSFSSSIHAEAVKPHRRFRNELAGRDPDSTPKRWRKCVKHVNTGLGWILSRFFVEKASSAEAKQFGDTIIADIKTEFAKKLEAVDWMDDETTERAVEKVHNIISKIGYPTKSPDIMDPSVLETYYQSLNITSDSFFSNVLSTRRFRVDHMWSALGKPVDREQWAMSASNVNAYYSPSGNEIGFPAGIMQFPVFDVEAPSYISYGGFGSVAGHELSHAFDNSGRHYDQYGNYTDWWSNATVDAFKEKAECFVQQYANFSVPGSDGKPLHVDGKFTLGENIADAGGLSAAFQAWKRRAADKPDKDLPGLEHFTHDQLFFVSYSNWWCGKTRKKTAISRIYTDPHAPNWARVLGTTANSREFRESFQCKVKEPTCELW